MDKFYTNTNISKKCIDTIAPLFPWSQWDLVIEPSTGNGSFLLQIPTTKKLGLDIQPEHKAIVEYDFLTYDPKIDGKILVIGNPPFGRVSSLAIKFFNHSAKWANVIAFIVPRTFRRTSIQNRLHLNFHIILDEDIPTKPCSFSPNMMAKCCWQIWERRNESRTIIHLETEHPDWQFIPFGPKDLKGQPTPPKDADFALRAYGGACGEIRDTNLELLRPKSWHWIKSNIEKKVLITRFNQLNYALSQNTSRQNSIGRGDLVRLYKTINNTRQIPHNS